jgi:hypothetical protein
VSSTNASGENRSRSAANDASLVSRPEIVMPSAYASTSRSSGVKTGFVA